MKKEQWTQSMPFAAVISDWFYITASRLLINEKSTKPFFFFLDLKSTDVVYRQDYKTSSGLGQLLRFSAISYTKVHGCEEALALGT